MRETVSAGIGRVGNLFYKSVVIPLTKPLFELGVLKQFCGTHVDVKHSVKLPLEIFCGQWRQRFHLDSVLAGKKTLSLVSNTGVNTM